MREIKFRAWDKTRRIMFDVYKMEWNEDGHLKSVRVVSLNNVIDNSPIEDVELIEYTGLKDKNGKEIYEGDIVKLDTGLEVEIYFEDALSYSYKYRSIQSNDIRVGTLWELGSWYEIEVIGNIYSNPELLEKR